MNGSIQMNNDSDRIIPFVMSGFDETRNFSKLLTFAVPNEACSNESTALVQKNRLFSQVQIN